jgi:hypothetical protein
VESDPFHWRFADARHLAEALHYAPDIGARGARLYALVLVAAAALLMFAGMAAEWLILAIGAGVLLPLLFRRAQRWWIARWLRHHAACQVTAVWDDSGYGTFGCRHAAPSRIAWDQVSQAIETSRYLILKTRPGPFFLPKEALETGAIEDLRERLDRHGIKRIVDTGRA